MHLIGWLGPVIAPFLMLLVVAWLRPDLRATWMAWGTVCGTLASMTVIGGSWLLYSALPLGLLATAGLLLFGTATGSAWRVGVGLAATTIAICVLATIYLVFFFEAQYVWGVMLTPPFVGPGFGAAFVLVYSSRAHGRVMCVRRAAIDDPLFGENPHELVVSDDGVYARVVRSLREQLDRAPADLKLVYAAAWLEQQGLGRHPLRDVLIDLAANRAHDPDGGRERLKQRLAEADADCSNTERLQDPYRWLFIHPGRLRQIVLTDERYRALMSHVARIHTPVALRRVEALGALLEDFGEPLALARPLLDHSRVGVTDEACRHDLNRAILKTESPLMDGS